MIVLELFVEALHWTEEDQEVSRIYCLLLSDNTYDTIPQFDYWTERGASGSSPRKERANDTRAPCGVRRPVLRGVSRTMHPIALNLRFHTLQVLPVNFIQCGWWRG